jgi:hypothetical protein
MSRKKKKTFFGKKLIQQSALKILLHHAGTDFSANFAGFNTSKRNRMRTSSWNRLNYATGPLQRLVFLK